MDAKFPNVLHRLREEKGLSQRTVAADLGISQALLSHYENGAREPGLPFVCRACDYYGVTADYLLGRTDQPMAPAAQLMALRDALRDLREAEARAAQALNSLTGEQEP